jgi:MFS family permease
VQTARSERAVLLLVAAVQFVNILDFMMVMPLGPDFARALGIPTSSLGLIGGSYTAAAAVSGLVGAFVLDRFDRRKALGVAMLGLVIGTACGGLAMGLPSLIAARVVAGAFGGPATAISVSIVSDVVPAERRGRAMGIVMGAFSVASVFGVPAGLELARLGGWRAPFFAVAAIGLIVAMGAVALLPPVRGHLDRAAGGHAPHASILSTARQPSSLLALLMVATAMAGSFALIPNFSSYFQFNGGYPRDGLGMLYLVAGAVSFVAMQVTGRMVDRFGATVVAAVGTAGFVIVVGAGCATGTPHLPALAFFVGFMLSQALRNVAMNTVSTMVARPHERAAYQSLQSSAQHLASAGGAILSSRLLIERPDHSLGGMERVAAFALSLSLMLPILVFAVGRQLRGRDRAPA